ncbi:MAG: O-antigen ligase family protein [Sphingomonas sp.]|nr:O-antigen ligase family protein [Sphingomonas sp.]
MYLSLILMTVKAVLVLTAAVCGFSALVRKEDAAWVRKAPLWLFLSMYLIGTFGHTYWVAYAALLLALPIAAKNRADAAALYCILVVSMPLLSQQLIFGSFYLIAGSKYLFCALGLGIAYLMNRGRDTVLHRARFAFPALLLVVLELSQARDPSVTATIRQCLPPLLTILLPYFVLSRSLNNAEDVRRFLLAFALSGFAMAAVATVEARLHWLIYKNLEGLLNIHTSINGYSKMRAGMLRAPASFPESTTLATFLVLAFMAVVALRDSFASRIKWYVALFVLLLGLVSANSRGAFISLGVGLVAWDLYCRRYGSLAVKLVGAGGAYLFALLAAQFSPYMAALVGHDAGTADTSDYRMQLLRRGMEEIHKHPYLGQNLKTALDNLQDLKQGEGIVDLVNGYIGYGLTLGYAGIIGLFLVFVSLCLAMLVIRGKVRRNPQLLEPAACVFAIASLSLLNSFFTGFGGVISTSFYQICALGAALWAMRGQVPAAQGASGGASPTPLSGLAAMIAADRDRARAGATAQA